MRNQVIRNQALNAQITTPVELKIDPKPIPTVEDHKVEVDEI